MSDFSSMIAPIESHQEEHNNEKHPEDRDSPMCIKLSERINDEDFSPGVFELSFFPIDHKHFDIELVIFLNNDGEKTEEAHRPC